MSKEEREAKQQAARVAADHAYAGAVRRLLLVKPGDYTQMSEAKRLVGTTTSAMRRAWGGDAEGQMHAIYRNILSAVRGVAA